MTSACSISNVSAVIQARKIGLSLICFFASLMLLFARIFWERARVAPAPMDPPKEPFFDGLGGYGRKIGTKSDLSQKYFNQGLAFLYGFNQEGAARAFEAAAICDPHCAMCFWGLAMANGPFINNMSLDRRQAALAWNAANRARELESTASPVERTLIRAICERHRESTPANRKVFDRAYAVAMERA